MASSCGKEYCPDTKCKLVHPFNGGKRARCERIKTCQNKICAPLSALGPSGFVLYDSCLQSCHLNEDDANNPQNFVDYSEYICTLYPGETLVEYYGVNPCGIDLATTSSAQKEADRQKIAASNQTLLWGVGAVLLLAVIFLLRRK